MNRHVPLILGLFSLFTVIACGSDSSGGDGSAGAGGQTGSAGTTGAAGSISGLKTVTCSKVGSKSCTIYGESTEAGVESRKASCTGGGGEVVDHCPSDGLVGCCLVAGVGTCQYDAGTAMTIMGVCTQQGGTWATTAP